MEEYNKILMLAKTVSELQDRAIQAAKAESILNELNLLDKSSVRFNLSDMQDEYLEALEALTDVISDSITRKVTSEVTKLCQPSVSASIDGERFLVANVLIQVKEIEDPVRVVLTSDGWVVTNSGIEIGLPFVPFAPCIIKL